MVDYRDPTGHRMSMRLVTKDDPVRDPEAVPGAAGADEESGVTRISKDDFAQLIYRRRLKVTQRSMDTDGLLAEKVFSANLCGECGLSDLTSFLVFSWLNEGRTKIRLVNACDVKEIEFDLDGDEYETDSEG